MKFRLSLKPIVWMAMAMSAAVSAAPIRNSTFSAKSSSNCKTRRPAGTCPARPVAEFSVTPGSASSYSKAVPKSSWLHPDCIWENHKWQTGTTDLAIVSKLKEPVYRASCETGVDPALIMAIVFQESHGILNIHRTIAPDGSSSNGIMQSDGCPSMEGRDPATISEQDIYGMVRCGAEHFKGNMKDHVKNPTHDPWVALRLYNSGSVAPSGDLNDGNGATGHYVIQVANRLRGWSN
ncbi:putative glycoside hydrolase protein [Venturia nashicola]|uniref:Putative glycoside hydrolase protein n=1 Tax=Venturia nashicola TaxID=86259 RepID=A0A4Z1P5F3_9PEZI|nr:putative glycoside hydrolase protein [Venturia nashicola]TLD30117.1 putative glycoside hydrolase protein [Venturia nashicola]